MPLKSLLSPPERRFGYLFVGFALLAFLVVFRFFGVATGDFLIFFVLLGFLVFIPGQALAAWFGVSARGIVGLSLSLSLGFVAAVIIPKFSLMVRAEFIIYAWVLTTFVWWLKSIIVRPPARFSFLPSGFSWRGMAGVGLVFCLFLIVLAVDNFKNGQLLPSGDLLLRMRFYDGFLRIACIRELVHSVPPQTPFAAGYPLSYHYGMDFFFSFFCRYGHLDVFAVSHRLGLSFLAFLLVLNLTLFLRSWLRTDSMAAFGNFYLLFGSGGLAYFFCWLFRAPFTGNIFLNFYFHDFISLNSLLPSLALLAAAFFSVAKWEESKEKSWALAASLLLAAVFEFKVFLLVPVAGGLFLASMSQFLLQKKKDLFLITWLTAVFSLPLFLTAFLRSREAMGYRFRLGPVDWITHLLRELRLPRWVESWSSLISGAPAGLENIIIGIAAVAIFLLGCFGLNLIGLSEAFRSLFKGSSLSSFFASFFLVSMANFFAVSLYLGQLARNILNIYVFYAGLIVLGFFSLRRLERLVITRKTRQKWMLLGLVCLLVVPNTWLYFNSRIKNPGARSFSRAFLAASGWLEKNAPAEAVVLHPSDMRYICYFAGRRVVLDNSIHSYLSFHLPRPAIRERLGDIDRFFHAPEKNVDVLFKYNVKFVWVDRERSWKEPGSDSLSPRVRFLYNPGPPSGEERIVELLPVFANEEHVIYLVNK